MKKTIALILMLTIALVFTACAGTSNVPSSPMPSDIMNGEIGGEITIYTFDSILTGPFLEEAARLFMEKHSDTGVIVNVESFSSMPEVRRSEGAGGGSIMIATAAGDPAAERRDYINMINTELMSGRGPDILALDVLPFHIYAQNGHLANIREFMDADPNFNINDYRVNIFDALNTDEGQFIFPINYDFRYVAFDSSLFTEDEMIPLETDSVFSFERLIEIGRDAFHTQNEEFPLFGMSVGPQRGMFQEMFSQNYSQFIDTINREANFADGTFADMLNQLVTLEEGNYISPRVNMPTGGGGGGDAIRSLNPEDIERMMNNRFFFKPHHSSMLINEFVQRAGNGGVSLMMGMSVMGGNTEDDKIAGLMGNGHGEVPFSVSQGFGINSNSENQRTAWEFIKFLSSDAMTYSMRVIGIPTHIGAFEERAALSITGALFSEHLGIDTPSDEMTPEQREALEEYIALIEYFTNQLNTFFVTDALAEEIVLNEVQEFFSGNRSAEDVANSLQSRINLFLNE